jgi:hypothetical protein
LDLSAQKRISSSANSVLIHNLPGRVPPVNKNMDLGLIVAVAMLVVWAVVTFLVNEAPGLTHALLIAGLTLLIWRIVKRDAPTAPRK